VLWDATSRGLCGRVGPPRTGTNASVRASVAWARAHSSCQAVRETLDLRRGYGPLFPRTVNDSNKGSNGPAGSSFIAKRGEGSA